MDTTYNSMEPTSVKYNIERFNYENGNIEIAGWIFIAGIKIESVKLCFRNRFQIYKVNLNFPLKRMDVYDAFGPTTEINCGFMGAVNFKSYKDFDVFLEYTFDKKTREIFLKTIRQGLKAKSKYIVSKANRHNVKKIFEYIFSRRMDLIKGFIFQADIIEPDIIEPGLKPLIDLYAWIKENITDETDEKGSTYSHVIDVIVPVYNGYHYFKSLFKSIYKTNMKFNLLVVNDKSTDENVQTYINDLKDRYANVRLIENEVNLGFVKSVNKALNVSENHVVILNTDIELPPYWLERLTLPIIKCKQIASATPFTNAGTICSFPKFGLDNQLFGELSVDEIDQDFQRIRPSYIEMPTGVGFCMALNKHALNEVGPLDEVNFAMGYGEENDWCQRAIKKGYKNVMVENLFVYHKHGGSFTSEQRRKLIEQNSQILSSIHPNYNKDVERFFSQDPAQYIREFVIMTLSSGISTKKPVLFFNHQWGGGATNYLDMQIIKMVSENVVVFVVSYNFQEDFYSFEYFFQGYKFTYRLTSLHELPLVLNYVDVGEIYVNELVSYPQIYQVLEEIIEIKSNFDARLIMLIHDYFPICPNYNLVNDKAVYCHLPNHSYCDDCLNKSIGKQILEYTSVEVWRKNWKEFLIQCDEIRTFSKSSSKILREAYGDLHGITIIPHEVNYIVPIKERIKTTKTLNIGLLGLLTVNKGLDIIESMLRVITERQFNIQIILIGTAEGTITSDHFKQTGRYNKENLVNLTLENDIDIFLIPSIWPETFSYTTEEIIKMDMPVAAFDLGAPAERIREYNKGMILEKTDADYILNKILNNLGSLITLPIQTHTV